MKYIIIFIVLLTLSLLGMCKDAGEYDEWMEKVYDNLKNDHKNRNDQKHKL